jgi:hypothetical protein
MMDLTCEAHAQLDCIESRIAQLAADYKQSQSAHERFLRAGDRGRARFYRTQAHMLIARLSYLIREKSAAERT